MTCQFCGDSHSAFNPCAESIAHFNGENNMLTPIAQSHLAALESELARVTAQRDALRVALIGFSAEATGICEDDHYARFAFKRHFEAASAALKACQD